MPEALTKWHFLGFAHDQKLRAGFLGGDAFCAKDIMVQPNPQRFLREGDAVEFTVKVSNPSDQRQAGRVRLNFINASDQQSADALLRVPPLGVPTSSGAGDFRPAKARTPDTEQGFDIPAQESRSCSWRITAPDGTPFLSYKAVAATGEFSDGEEGGPPVLSRRILVTESLPLPMCGPATKNSSTKNLPSPANRKRSKARA